MTTPDRPRFPAIQTARELAEKVLPALQYLIAGLLPCGLYICAGDPKLGKSLLWQSFGYDIAFGKPVFGAFDAGSGQVLYINLEGGEVAFRHRQDKMLANAPKGDDGMDNFHVVYNAPQIGRGLEDCIRTWIEEQPNPRLIVIDTMSAVAPSLRGNDRHTEEYAMLRGLADLTNDVPSIVIVLIHHTRKGEAEDTMHKISGSQGLTAATDGNMVLSRVPGAKKATLSIRPRNAEEAELTVVRDDATLTWQLMGDDERAQLSTPRQRILAVLDVAGAEGMTPSAVAAGAEMSYDSARQHLSSMAADGQVHKPARGRYAAITTAPLF